MKRLKKETSNSGNIIVELEKKSYDEFKKNLFTALRKFGSGKKTRAVHKLVDKNMVINSLFTGEISDTLTVTSLDQSKLKAILMNLYQYDDSISGQGSAALATELLDIEKKIKKEETFVNEARLHNIEKLKEKQEKTEEKFLKALDYIKMIDGIYFGYLTALAYHAVIYDSAGKPKMVAVASDILASILKKIYQQVNNKIEGETHQLIEAIAIYFIKMYYYGESSTYALNSLKKKDPNGHPAFSEEIVDTIKRAKVNKIDSFNDLSKLLKETELIPITPTTFDLQMNRMFGKFAYEEYIQPSLVNFLAFMANMAQPNQLFKDSYPADQDLHERLEELLLNEQKKITLKDREI